MLGYPVALLLASLTGRLKYLLTLVFVIPLLMSYIIKIYAIRSLLGGNGFLNRMLIAAGIIDQPITFLIFNLYAVMITLALILLPFTMLPIFITLDRIPRQLVDASYDLGATGWQTFRRVILPLSLSGTLVGASFTFVLALGDFVTPQMVGGMNGLTFGRIIYSQFGFAFNWPFGAALSVILLVFVAVVLLADGPRLRRARRGDAMRLSRLGDRGALRCVAAFVVLLLYGPLAVAIFFSFFRLRAERGAVGQLLVRRLPRALPQRGDPRRADQHAARRRLGGRRWRSIFGTLIAFHYHSSRSRLRHVLQFVVFLPFLMPPIITGLSLLIFFRETDVPRSLATVIVGHTVFVLAIVYRIVLTRLQALKPSLIDASLDLGASRWQTFRYVAHAQPDARPSSPSAILAFALSFDETLITLLVTGTQNTLPMWLWSSMRLGFKPDINALVALILFFSAALAYVAMRLFRPEAERLNTVEQFIGNRSPSIFLILRCLTPDFDPAEPRSTHHGRPGAFWIILRELGTSRLAPLAEGSGSAVALT